MSIQEIMDEVQELSSEEREHLIQMIQESIAQKKGIKQRSLLELAGLGAEIWAGIDAQEYVDQMRAEWDHRP